jgi:hypothetical protein
MNPAEIKQSITQKLSNLDIDQLTLVDNLLNQLTVYLGKAPRQDEQPADPLASLRNSDFIGCFSGDPDLATNSEAIAHQIFAKAGDHQP